MLSKYLYKIKLVGQPPDPNSDQWERDGSAIYHSPCMHAYTHATYRSIYIYIYIKPLPVFSKKKIVHAARYSMRTHVYIVICIN